MEKDVKNPSESSDEEVLDGSDIPDMGELEEEDKLEEEEEISDEQDEEEVDEVKALPEKKSRYSDRVRELVQQRKDKENEVSELKKKMKVVEDERDKEKGMTKEEKDTRSLKEQLKDELAEDSFMESQGIENEYDSELVLKGLRPIAKSLMVTKRASTYKQALELAKTFDKKHAEKGVTKLQSSAGGGISTKQETVSKKEIQSANKMGISLKELLSYKKE